MPILAAWKYLTREMRRSDGCVLRRHIGDAKLCVLNRHNFESIWKNHDAELLVQSFLCRSSCADLLAQKLLAQIARAEALDIAAPVYVMLSPCPPSATRRGCRIRSDCAGIRIVRAWGEGRDYSDDAPRGVRVRRGRRASPGTDAHAAAARSAEKAPAWVPCARKEPSP